MLIHKEEGSGYKKDNACMNWITSFRVSLNDEGYGYDKAMHVCSGYLILRSGCGLGLEKKDLNLYEKDDGLDNCS